MKRKRVWIFKAAFIVLLFALLGYSLWQYRQRQDWDLDLGKLKSLPAGAAWLLLAQVFIGMTLALTFIRWRMLLLAQGIEYRLRDAFALGFIGFFFNQFIPGATGGDLIKAYYVAVDHPQRRAAGVTTVFLDRVIGLLVLVGVAAVAIAANWPRITTVPELKVLAALVAAVLAGSAAAAALFFSSRLRSQPAVQSLLTKLPFHDLLRKIQAAVYVYKHHPGLVVKVLLISVVVQLSVVGMAISYALALGGGADLATFFFIVPIASLAMSIPIGLPGGLGQSEIAYLWLFRTVGYGGGFLLALLQRVNYALWAMVGAVLYFRRRGTVQRARRLAEESGGLELESAAEVEAASRAG